MCCHMEISRLKAREFFVDVKDHQKNSAVRRASLVLLFCPRLQREEISQGGFVSPVEDILPVDDLQWTVGPSRKNLLHSMNNAFVSNSHSVFNPPPHTHARGRSYPLTLRGFSPDPSVCSTYPINDESVAGRHLYFCSLESLWWNDQISKSFSSYRIKLIFIPFSFYLAERQSTGLGCFIWKCLFYSTSFDFSPASRFTINYSFAVPLLLTLFLVHSLVLSKQT